MAAITLANARTSVRRLLDDNGQNKRYPDAQIDEALQAALSSCLSDYVTNGGDAFDTVSTVTTSTTGAVTLSAPVLAVRSISLVQGQNTYSMPAVARGQTRMNDNAARNLTVEAVLDYQIPTDTSHPLVGVGAVAAPTWAGFDQWVCATAALTCGITDNDRRTGLEKLEERLRQSALKRENTPSSQPLPDSVLDGYNGWWTPLGYVFTGGSIQLVTTDSAWL